MCVYRDVGGMVVLVGDGCGGWWLWCTNPITTIPFPITTTTHCGGDGGCGAHIHFRILIRIALSRVEASPPPQKVEKVEKSQKLKKSKKN